MRAPGLRVHVKTAVSGKDTSIPYAPLGWTRLHDFILRDVHVPF